MKHIVTCLAVPLLLSGLSGCYYPVYSPSPYGYAPPPQGNPAPASDQQCREYTTSTTIEGKRQQLYGEACLQPDGSWRDSGNGSQLDAPPAPRVAAPAYAPAPPAYYYPAPAYYAPPAYYPAPYPSVTVGGFYGGGGGHRHWR